MVSKTKFDKLIVYVENIIYSVIAVLLFVTSILLIYDEVLMIIAFFHTNLGIESIIEIISRTLMLLVIIEILTTVRISYREHALCAEPFLIIGLIASIRRILIISVETAYVQEKFANFMIEIGVLVGLVFVFVLSIVILRKYDLNKFKGD